MADVLATVWAGAVHMNHGHLEWVSRQLFGDTAEREFLIRLAAKYGITPTPATFATGTVTATGTIAFIPLGTVLVRDDGATYQVTAEATIAGVSSAVSVQAVAAGSAGNLAEGETLSFESPISGVDSTATVSEPGIADGLDEEKTEDFRARYLLRRRDPPAGGSDQDYEAWALAVAGVTRAWVYRHELGLGTVVVRFVLDTEADIFPTVGKVAEVQAAIEADRPTTAEPTVEAPVELPVNFTIAVTPDTAAVRAAVEAELVDLFYRVAEPGDGVLDGDGIYGGTVLISAMRTAIGVAEGSTNYVLTVPAADVVPAVGELAQLGVVTWA